MGPADPLPGRPAPRCRRAVLRGVRRGPRVRDRGTGATGLRPHLRRLGVHGLDGHLRLCPDAPAQRRSRWAHGRPLRRAPDHVDRHLGGRGFLAVDRARPELQPAPRAAWCRRDRVGDVHGVGDGAAAADRGPRAARASIGGVPGRLPLRRCDGSGNRGRGHRDLHPGAVRGVRIHAGRGRPPGRAIPVAGAGCTGRGCRRARVRRARVRRARVRRAGVSPARVRPLPLPQAPLLPRPRAPRQPTPQRRPTWAVPHRRPVLRGRPIPQRRQVRHHRPTPNRPTRAEPVPSPRVPIRHHRPTPSDRGLDRPPGSAPRCAARHTAPH